MKSQLKNLLLASIIFFIGNSCKNQVNEDETNESNATLLDFIKEMPSIEGKEKYLSSPSVTAGSRVYAVGYQDGSFPDLGWHVEGEMGGIWAHPIKLMDGFTAQLNLDSEAICLEKATLFRSYPIGNERVYNLKAQNLVVRRFQFVPDATEGMIVEYIFENTSKKNKSGTFSFSGFSDLSPVWLSEKLGIIDGNDKISFNKKQGNIVATDSNNDWCAMWGANIMPIQFNEIPSCDYDKKGKGTGASLVYPLEIAASSTSTIQFYIAGSYESGTDAALTYKQLASHSIAMLRDKKNQYETIDKTAKLSIPDKDVEQAFEWIKYNTDWLVRDVPEIGEGLSAGLPDYPWWFGCDNTYSLQGVLATGRPELARKTLQLIHDLSIKTNHNGRIIHEVSTNGVVFNPGNINETPHFAFMIWDYYRWTGDEFLLKEYFPTVKKGLEWLLKENDTNGNLTPEGAGMMEIHGLDSEMIDVAVYTQQGFEAAAKIAAILGENELKDQYEEVAAKLKKSINTDWWVEEADSYADFIASKEKALELVEGAIIRADTLKKPWAVKELELTKKELEKLPANITKGHVMHHNWVVNTPLEMGIADNDKALKALETASKFVNPFGVFVTGIDRDESAGIDDGSFAENKKIFSYVGAVMTLPTEVQAISESNYGRPDKALGYLKKMANSFSYAFPGGMYEVSPDFGMMVQAWNIYAMGKPIIHNFFGVRPEAWREYIIVKPQLPSNWKNVSLKNILVGNNYISLFKNEENGGETWHITQTQGRWHIEFMIPNKTGIKVTLNGDDFEVDTAKKEVLFVLEGIENKIEIKY